MNKRENTGVILGTILVIVLLTAYFIRSNKLESLEKEYEELQEQYYSLLEETSAASESQYGSPESQDKDLQIEHDMLNNQYGELNDKYFALLIDYEDYKDLIWKYEGDAATVWCYFEGEEDTTFNEAKESYLRLYSVIYAQ